MRYSYDSFLAELGKKLRQMRVDRGWTLRHMIVTHGFHLAHWQGFEKGKGMSIPSLLRVCEVFDVSVEELIAGLGAIKHENTKAESAAVHRNPGEPEPKPIPSETLGGSRARSPRRKRS